MKQFLKTCDMCAIVIEHGTEALKVIFKLETVGGTNMHIGELDVCKKCETHTDLQSFVRVASKRKR